MSTRIMAQHLTRQGAADYAGGITQTATMRVALVPPFDSEGWAVIQVTMDDIVTRKPSLPVIPDHPMFRP